MTATLRILRTAPLTTIQDRGRFGMLRHGVAASGPMDGAGFAHAALLAGGAGETGIEFTTAGINLVVESGACRIGFAGGLFRAKVNDTDLAWPGSAQLSAGDRLSITAGPQGNYGYLRFDGDIPVPAILGSRATNSGAGLGGYSGRPLAAGDQLQLAAPAHPHMGAEPPPANGDVLRILWGLHADLFPSAVREGLLTSTFTVTSAMDRMGVRLRDDSGIFSAMANLSLVSDAIVAGDIQILGGGTPIVLMRDHQPTGGYPRVATIVSADIHRFAQMRPGAQIRFESVSLTFAQSLMMRSGRE